MSVYGEMVQFIQFDNVSEGVDPSQSPYYDYPGEWGEWGDGCRSSCLAVYRVYMYLDGGSRCLILLGESRIDFDIRVFLLYSLGFLATLSCGFNSFFLLESMTSIPPITLHLL